MKKPYVKKFSTISNFDVWIVDGKYIRENIDEEFTNIGQNYKFKFIPENEFWIDKETVPGEEKYFIDHLIIERRLMKKGYNYNDAVEKADIIEKRERNKSEIMKELKEKRIHKQEVLNRIHIKLLKPYSGKMKIWIVSGELVRDLFFIDFTEGGHDKVYPFIPEGEVWIDDDLNQKERKFVLLHELFERNLMIKGMKYDSAHKKASEIELKCRHNTKILDAELKKAIKNNN